MIRGVAIGLVAFVTMVAGCSLDERNVVLPGSFEGASRIEGLGPAPLAGDGGVPSGADDALDPELPQTEDQVAGALGAVCQVNTHCTSGNCVDGVCCDSPCTDLCAACNLAGGLGVCSAAPSDPLCPEVICPGQSSECRPLGSAESAGNCETVGVCRSSADCTATVAPAGMPCQQATGTCDGQGACVVPDKLPLGQPCEADDACAEGHCVASLDGAPRCCDAACDGVCQACNTAGRCEATPATDARCEAIACPADNVCRDYVETISADLCRGFGQCRSSFDCGTPEFFTTLLPDAQCVCDPASGNCALAAGAPCAQGPECASRACVPTAAGNLVCCAASCAAGLFCSSTGTSCVQCEGTGVECDGNVQRTCNAGVVATTTCGNGCTPGVGCNDLPPVGLPCDAGQCAAGAACQQDTGGVARCCVRNCAAEGKVCSPTGSCVCPPGQVAAGDGCLLRAGDPCQGGAQCQTGLSCIDGVCCQEACGGFCERCQAGTGACVAVAAGQQDLDPASGNSCSNGFECTGALNGCRARTGQPCSSNDGSDCVSGSCEATSGGGARVCCSQACDGLRQFCSSTGQGCVQCDSAAQCGNGCNLALGTCNPPRAPGEPCSVAGQCSTNACVPAEGGGGLSRCCANCAVGQVCNAQGQCVSSLRAPGEPCSAGSQCANGQCSFWFVDSDGDGFGSGASTGACGSVPPSIRLLPNQTLTLDGGDCCPSDPGTFPGFTPPFNLPAQTQPDACDGVDNHNGFDRDCSGRVENSLQDTLDALGGPIVNCQAVPNITCSALAGTSNGFSAWLGELPPCGEFGTQIACQVSENGFCTALIGGQLDNRCR